MKFIHISDTKGRHHLLKNLSKATVIVHTGDFTENGTEEEALDFIEWFSGLPYEHKIFIAGTKTIAFMIPCLKACLMMCITFAMTA